MTADELDARQKLAHLVQPFVVRKTIKQTVMTTVYGVTFIGAKKQIYERLMDHAGPGGPLEVGMLPNILANCYLSILNFFDKICLVKCIENFYVNFSPSLEYF